MAAGTRKGTWVGLMATATEMPFLSSAVLRLRELQWRKPFLSMLWSVYAATHATASSVLRLHLPQGGAPQELISCLHPKP